MRDKVCNIICHVKRATKAFCIYCKLNGIFYKKLCFCSFSLIIFHDKGANSLYQDQSWLFVILCHKCIQRSFCLVNILYK